MACGPPALAALLSLQAVVTRSAASTAAGRARNDVLAKNRDIIFALKGIPPAILDQRYRFRVRAGGSEEFLLLLNCFCDETEPKFCQRQQCGGASRGAGGDPTRQRGAHGG